MGGFAMFADGFSQIMEPQILLLCLAGVILGIFFGASPGMTSSMGIALILPVTYGMTLSMACRFFWEFTSEASPAA